MCRNIQTVYCVVVILSSLRRAVQYKKLTLDASQSREVTAASALAGLSCDADAVEVGC